MKFEVKLPDKSTTVEIHSGTRGLTFTVWAKREGEDPLARWGHEYLTLPDLASVDAVIAALQQCRRGIAQQQAGEAAP